MAPSRRSQLFVLYTLAVLAGLYLILSIDYRPTRSTAPPSVVERVAPIAATRAGASRQQIVPPFPVPLGGYNTRGSEPAIGVLDPPGVRALVVEAGAEKVALVSVELVVLPAPLRRKVWDRVSPKGITRLVIAATHTHEGPGGFWDRRVAEWIGLGNYDARIEDFLVDRISQAVLDAAGDLRDATFATATIEASNFSFNRARQGGPVDNRLTALRVDAADGTAIARLVVFAAHPTMLRPDHMKMSGDWPGSMMHSLEESNGCPVLFWQGAVGDVTWGKRSGEMTHEERLKRFGEAVASDARGAIAAAVPPEGPAMLSFAREEIALPPNDVGGAVWGPFEPLAGNVMQWLVNTGHTTVSVLHLGPFHAALLPGELVAELGLSWRRQLGGATVVSLVDDYVGYVESPENVEKEEGEAQRQYFTAELAPVLLEGLAAAELAAAPTAPVK